MKTNATAILTTLFFTVLVPTGLALGQPPRVPERSPAVSGDRATWPVQSERTQLRVTSRAGVRYEAIFEPGESPTVSLGDLVDRDGTVDQRPAKYSLTRLGADKPGEATLPLEGRELDDRTQFGVLRWGAQPVDEETGSGLRTKTSALVEQSGAPFLELEDTTQEGNGTETDWTLQVDSVFFGDGDSDFALFSFDDSGSSSSLRVPFVVENEAPNNALYVDLHGYVGIGTNQPITPLHITSPLPKLILEDNVGATHMWSVSGGSSFNVFDYGNNSAPLIVNPGSSTATLSIDPAGVGIGTFYPQGNLHIFGQDNKDVFSGIGPDLINGPAFNFGYSGSSFGTGSGFFNARPAAGAVAPNPALYFMTNNIDRMLIDRDGDIAVDMDNSFGNSFDPQHPVHAQLSGAYLSAAGVWTSASSRALKENVESLSLEAALAALANLQPVTYNYKAMPDDPQVGFIAEDVPDLVATPDRKTLAHGEIVSVLTRVLQDVEERLEAQEEQLRRERAARAALEQKLETLQAERSRHRASG